MQGSPDTIENTQFTEQMAEEQRALQNYKQRLADGCGHLSGKEENKKKDTDHGRCVYYEEFRESNQSVRVRDPRQVNSSISK